MANDYAKDIKVQIKQQQENLKANQIPPVTKANEKRQVEIKQNIENLKGNIKKK
jgi:hypothetical protein